MIESSSGLTARPRPWLDFRPIRVTGSDSPKAGGPDLRAEVGTLKSRSVAKGWKYRVASRGEKARPTTPSNSSKLSRPIWKIENSIE